MPALVRPVAEVRRSPRSSREAPRIIPDRGDSENPRRCLVVATAPPTVPTLARTEAPVDTHGHCRGAQGRVGMRSSVRSELRASSTYSCERKTSVVGEPMEKCAVKPHHLLKPAVLLPPFEDVSDEITPGDNLVLKRSVHEHQIDRRTTTASATRELRQLYQHV